MTEIHCSRMGKILTFHKVRAGINLPDNLTTVRAIDATVLVVQEVFGQDLIYKQRKWSYQVPVITMCIAEIQAKNMPLA